jgi:hypothetical protein
MMPGSPQQHGCAVIAHPAAELGSVFITELTDDDEYIIATHSINPHGWGNPREARAAARSRSVSSCQCHRHACIRR